MPIKKPFVTYFANIYCGEGHEGHAKLTLVFFFYSILEPWSDHNLFEAFMTSCTKHNKHINASPVVTFHRQTKIAMAEPWSREQTEY